MLRRLRDDSDKPLSRRSPLPGYLSTGALFYGFAGAAFVAMLLLIPHWNRMPAAD